ncbi:MAG: alpha-L-fucosidase [Lachnospiraceae bacterium]|nr:alpha-L-fucosidase [Lachnospiraceae bacterium]
MASGDEKLISVIPTERQIQFQELEFYAFIHFTVNTFTDKEWGDGNESPDIFNPEKLDAEQWVRNIKAAGMRGLILTCKHHDGFCLWPSKYTDHTVAKSPYKSGNGDVVKEVSKACEKYGIKFGIYLSPWDRNCGLYGSGKAYDDFFINQLTELLINYGEIFSVWFDGACGEGPNGKKQYYDWERYYQKIRELQPNACISVCGPDVRWCGNEAGQTRAAEWSVVPERAKDSEIIAEKSQQEDSEEFRLRRVDARDADLGSREILKGEERLIWYPAEVNTSIRPGWFYHKYEDDKVRPLEELLHIYMNSVGGNATFLLNIPPTREGLLHENDCKRLHEIGEALQTAFANNLMDKAELESNGTGTENIRADNYEAGMSGKSADETFVSVKWPEPICIEYIVIKEDIHFSQRIEKFEVEAKINGVFETVYKGTVVGHKRIVPLDRIATDMIRIRITDSRNEPIISFMGIYGLEEK